MITVIATVLNEGESINRLMDSLLAQTLPPKEVVIVDGGSTDDTLTRLKAYEGKLSLKVLQQQGCNISEGRNLAFAHATYDVIAITDAGVRLPANWLENITRPLREDPALTVSCGFFEADPHTLFEVAMGATVLPFADEVNPQTFLPSSRSVAVHRRAFEAVGGYPEWLDYCEDLVFDLRLKATQPPFAFTPSAVVQFRPRGTLKAFFIQYYRYARGDGKADLWRKRHVIRYLAYLVGLPALLAMGALLHPLFWGVLAVGGFAYCRAPYRRLPAVMARYRVRAGVGAWAYVIALVPLIRAVGDVAKMLGYPVGVWWRWRNAKPHMQLYHGLSV
jgi:glycosyltransferase involved in cell wall biosynthesis